MSCKFGPYDIKPAELCELPELEHRRKLLVQNKVHDPLAALHEKRVGQDKKP
jgi:hypothetical protein